MNLMMLQAIQSPAVIGALTGAGLAGLGVALVATPWMGAATMSYLLMVAGLRQRKDTRNHMPLMSLAIGVDFVLVLGLELSRGATGKAMALDGVPLIHVLVSSLAIGLYPAVIWLGRGRRAGHVRVAVVAFFLRTLGFVTMFSMI